MARNLLRLLFKIIYFLAWFARFFLAPAIRGIGFALILMVITLFAVLKSIDESAKRAADYWLKEIQGENHDNHFDEWLYWVVRIATYILLAIGWVLLAHLTVFLFGLLFR